MARFQYRCLPIIAMVVLLLHNAGSGGPTIELVNVRSAKLGERDYTVVCRLKYNPNTDKNPRGFWYEGTNRLYKNTTHRRVTIGDNRTEEYVTLTIAQVTCEDENRVFRCQFDGVSVAPLPHTLQTIVPCDKVSPPRVSLVPALAQLGAPFTIKCCVTWSQYKHTYRTVTLSRNGQTIVSRDGGTTSVSEIGVETIYTRRSVQSPVDSSVSCDFDGTKFGCDVETVEIKPNKSVQTTVSKTVRVYKKPKTPLLSHTPTTIKFHQTVRFTCTGNVKSQNGMMTLTLRKPGRPDFAMNVTSDTTTPDPIYTCIHSRTLKSDIMVTEDVAGGVVVCGVEGIPYTANVTIRVCKAGTFGKACGQKCRCARDAECNQFTGACLGKCVPGYRLSNCQTRCEVGSFGDSCCGVCRCTRNLDCSHVDGACAGQGCISGYEPGPKRNCYADLVPTIPDHRAATVGERNYTLTCHLVYNRQLYHMNGTWEGYDPTAYSDVLVNSTHHTATTHLAIPVVTCDRVGAPFTCVFSGRKRCEGTSVSRWNVSTTVVENTANTPILSHDPRKLTKGVKTIFTCSSRVATDGSMTLSVRGSGHDDVTMSLLSDVTIKHPLYECVSIRTVTGVVVLGEEMGGSYVYCEVEGQSIMGKLRIPWKYVKTKPRTKPAFSVATLVSAITGMIAGLVVIGGTYFIVSKHMARKHARQLALAESDSDLMVCPSGPGSSGPGQSGPGPSGRSGASLAGSRSMSKRGEAATERVPNSRRSEHMEPGRMPSRREPPRGSDSRATRSPYESRTVEPRYSGSRTKGAHYTDSKAHSKAAFNASNTADKRRSHRKSTRRHHSDSSSTTSDVTPTRRNRRKRSRYQ